jgi:hypothetical protein
MDQKVATKTSQSQPSSKGQKKKNKAKKVAAEKVEAEKVAALWKRVDDVDELRAWAVTKEGKKALLEMGWEEFCPTVLHLHPQSYGNRFANYFGRFYGWTKVPSGEKRGDFVEKSQYIEVKTSAMSDYLHVKQIRLWQDVDVYVVMHVGKRGKLTRFDLTHAQMKEEVDRMGFSSHTRKAATSARKDPQNLQFKIGSEHWHRWVKNYQNCTDLIGCVLFG